MLKGKNLVIAVLLVLVCVLGFSNIQNSKDIDSLTSQGIRRDGRNCR